MSNKLFGVKYFDTKNPSFYEASTEQLYYFSTYIGSQTVPVEKGDSIYYFNEALDTAIVEKGPCTIKSQHLATIIRGYMHPKATISLKGVTTLPYINGCSTKQIFPPIRLGDPTLQYLKVPPFSKEQEHHIHSTFRVVLILEGKGKSIVGLNGKTETTDLGPGTVCIFEPMSPHHFETDTESSLIAIPLHIYSTIGSLEKNHPMFNGTINI
jgi:mannose-6-phosphate isomerase-like protein (cupin superfamily)